MKFEFNPEFHKYRLDGMPLRSVSEILNMSFRTIFYTETGASKGKDIHKDCEDFDLGARAALSFKYPQWVEQWSLCLQDDLKLVEGPERLAFKKPEVEYASYYAEGGRFFAGTTDRKKLSLFRLWVLDLKVGAVNQPRDIIQIHAYFKILWSKLPLWKKLILKAVGDIWLINVYLRENKYEVYRYRYKKKIWEYFKAMQDSLEILEKPGKITKFYGE